MTGPLTFDRQHSSTAGCSSANKMVRPKVRRWSSADDQNLLEVTFDDGHYKVKSPIKRNQTPNDDDSGVEDLDQPVNNYTDSPSGNVAGDEEPCAAFDACEDEDYEEYSTPISSEQSTDPEQQFLDGVREDLTLAGKVSDDDKKLFCPSTMEVFHGEFARRLAYPIALNFPGVRYYLLAEDEINSDPCQWPGFAFVKLDNAKAQFKCPNKHCRRLWTSMRARISFKVSYPQPHGFIVLKTYGQVCEHCETPADALWYMEEVCRVMKNLTIDVFNALFPMLLNDDHLQDVNAVQTVEQSFRRSRHDSRQRQGKMHAPHNRDRCEACQRGWCYT